MCRHRTIEVPADFTVELRFRLFWDAAVDTRDVHAERVEGAIIHRLAGGDDLLAGIVLDRSREGVQRARDNRSFLLFENLDGGRWDRGIERRHHHHSFLDTPPRMPVASPGTV